MSTSYQFQQLSQDILLNTACPIHPLIKRIYMWNICEHLKARDDLTREVETVREVLKYSTQNVNLAQGSLED